MGGQNKTTHVKVRASIVAWDLPANVGAPLLTMLCTQWFSTVGNCVPNPRDSGDMSGCHSLVGAGCCWDLRGKGQ